MTKIYPLFHPYGNYLDNYYVSDYETFITYLLNNFAKDSQEINLGITDGVTIINVLKGDFSGYNLCIVEKEDGQQDIYKITKKEFIRKGIWRVSMVLDVFSKYYENVKESSVLVNRLGFREWDKFNPILFNNEDLELSEVKKEQTELKIIEPDIIDVYSDIRKDAKLGGYLLFVQQGQIGSGLSVTISTSGTDEYDYTVEGIENYILYNKHLRVDYDYLTDPEVFYKWNGTGRKSIMYSVDCINMDENNGTKKQSVSRYGETYPATWRRKRFSEYGLWYYESGSYSSDELPETSDESLLNILDNYIKNNLVTDLTYNTYKNYKGKKVLDTATNTIYEIQFSSLSTYRTYPLIPDNTISSAFGRTLYSYGGSGIQITLKETIYEVQLVETGKKASGTVTINLKRETSDEGYGIIFIPKIEYTGAVRVMWIGTGQIDKYYYSTQIVTALISALVSKYGGENGVILDVQETYFLPNIGGETRLSGGGTNYPGTIFYDLGKAIYGQSSEPDQDTWDVITIGGIGGYAIPILALEKSTMEMYIENKIEVEDYKLEQMNKYILRSPSGASTYDFSIARNDGVLGFNFKASLRPYGSMYQVQPVYDGYYGTNFTDTRGLVMLEDTSITQTTDLYEQYKRQNVNYINSFESNLAYERSSLQVSQDLEKTNFLYDSSKRVINSSLDTIGDVVSLGAIGQAYGFNASNMQGATAGAGLGGTVIGEAIEYGQLLANQKAERKQLELSQAEAKRQWKYNLSNMKALPLNTEKVSGIYNTNAKQFILEKYTPTDYELNLYKDYLELYGISVGAVISLNEYPFDYIEGEVVLYSGEITNEEYEELQLELNSGRREYIYEQSDETTE